MQWDDCPRARLESIEWFGVVANFAEAKAKKCICALELWSFGDEDTKRAVHFWRESCDSQRGRAHNEADWRCADGGRKRTKGKFEGRNQKSRSKLVWTDLSCTIIIRSLHYTLSRLALFLFSLFCVCVGAGGEPRAVASACCRLNALGRFLTRFISSLSP
jgi:hypothetical protein